MSLTLYLKSYKDTIVVDNADFAIKAEDDENKFLLYKNTGVILKKVGEFKDVTGIALTSSVRN